MSAYDEGYEAFQDGDEKDDNPYNMVQGLLSMVARI